jgi:26S proteasome regulatory subunit T1
VRLTRTAVLQRHHQTHTIESPFCNHDSYDQIGGCKEQIEKIKEVVETPLLEPEKFVALGIDPPKGVLLFGPPGTGKTLCARAVANRTDATFIRVIGSELVQKYVGEGARMVRNIFVSSESTSMHPVSSEP